METEAFVHGDFFGAKAEISKEKDRFIESYDDHPGYEEGGEDPETRHPRISEFSCGLATTHLDPLDPAGPFHHKDMDQGGDDSESQSPALEKPPAFPVHTSDHFLERKDKKGDEEEDSNETSSKFPRAEVKPFLRKFFGKKKVANNAMKDCEKASDNPYFFAVGKEVIPAVEITGEWSEEECKSKEGHPGTGDSFVGDK
jgi:hypothetical protein